MSRHKPVPVRMAGEDPAGRLPEAPAAQADQFGRYWLETARLPTNDVLA